MEDWKRIKIRDISSIERVTYFQVWSHSKFPYGSVRIKISEDVGGNHIGIANMAAKNKNGRSPDWIVGRGQNISEALNQTIHNLLQTISENGAVGEDDFEWADPCDF